LLDCFAITIREATGTVKPSAENVVSLMDVLRAAWNLSSRRNLLSPLDQSADQPRENAPNELAVSGDRCGDAVGKPKERE
jgi:hypothetical protein